jgi:lipopolysaccharide transport system permease protein
MLYTYHEQENKVQNATIFKNYIHDIWRSRYLCWHLAKSDLRNKFRRSSLGILWCLIHPLALTILLSFIIGSFFHLNVREYVLFVFSGLIVWELLNSTLLSSCNALINAEAYIKQYRRPLAIYSLRCLLVTFTTFLLAFSGFVVWDFFGNYQNINFSCLSLFLSFAIYIFTLWPVGILVSFITARFRDFNQLIVIFMQFLWYVSPVFFQPKMFFAIKLDFLVRYNPVFHFMNLIRAPMLYGACPSLTSYLFTLGIGCFFWFLAILTLVKQESKLIFYL